MIERILLYENEIRKAVMEKRMEPYVQQDKNGCRPSVGHISDPTAMSAIRNLSDIEQVWIEVGPRCGDTAQLLSIQQPEKWLKIAEMTKTYFRGTKHGVVLEQKYRQNRPIHKIAEELVISKALVYNLLNEVVLFSEGCAVAMGIKIVARPPTCIVPQ